MARKNRNAVKGGKIRKVAIPKNHHFLYYPDDYADPTVVRYLGEQDGEWLYVFHPEGFPMWAHMHQLSNPARAAA